MLCSLAHSLTLLATGIVQYNHDENHWFRRLEDSPRLLNLSCYGKCWFESKEANVSDLPA